jgi:GNAT superfamily N-acetyltransferase
LIRNIESAEERSAICERILRALPTWFGIESSLKNYVRDVATMTIFAAVEDEEVIGFLSLNPHNAFTAEIHVMGVMQGKHRQGVGKALVRAAEVHLRSRGFEYFSVKTLSPARPNREYEITRNFYFATGFLPVEEFKTLWGEANPCWLMIKSLARGATEQIRP